ncbi:MULTISPECIES: hypothetical protein [unclassified Caballeronia]|uniref:hypothetical protein n=1 Tax=unclassified Caballeronia TaxID=2646786 RepID=UPI00285A06A5|nr:MULTISPECIES: hypothetical protein [unclassified Caballeronia]MDR5739713.1 hypothetical protein [Caballeronia sp. LZ016]MDR5808179.1 hypothetical protein [Caballeronia sp. LZ019]
MDDLDDLDGVTQTTAAGLMRLASVIATLARDGEVDTRFGAKLFKRLDKEARRVAERGDDTFDGAARDALFAAIGELDVALRQRDAASLVEANARLREREEAPAKRRKGKKESNA